MSVGSLFSFWHNRAISWEGAVARQRFCFLSSGCNDQSLLSKARQRRAALGTKRRPQWEIKLMCVLVFSPLSRGWFILNFGAERPFTSQCSSGSAKITFHTAPGRGCCADCWAPASSPVWSSWLIIPGTLWRDSLAWGEKSSVRQDEPITGPGLPIITTHTAGLSTPQLKPEKLTECPGVPAASLLQLTGIALQKQELGCLYCPLLGCSRTDGSPLARQGLEG